MSLAAHQPSPLHLSTQLSLSSLSQLPSPTSFFGPNSSFATSQPFDFQLFPSPASASSDQGSPPPFQSSSSDRESSPATSYLGTPSGSPQLGPSDLPRHAHAHGGVQQQQPLFQGGPQYYQSQQHAQPIQQIQQKYQAPESRPIAQHPQDAYPVYSAADIYAPPPSVHAPQHVPQASLPQYQQQQPQQQQQQQTYYSAASVAVPMLQHPVPQLFNQQHAPISHPPYAHAQIAPAAPQQAFYSQVAPPQHQQQQMQQYQQAPPPPPQQIAYTYPAPSFETPQGTYYFVPNSSANAVPVILAPAGLVRGHSAAASIGSVGSWSESDEKPSLGGKKRKANQKNQTKRFICPHPECGRAFARNFNMQSHLKSHLGIRDFDCPHCTKKFSRRHDRARHCAAVHDSHIENDHDDEDEDDASEHDHEHDHVDG